MISKADSISIMIFSITINGMKKAMRIGNSNIFKSNFYIYA